MLEMEEETRYGPRGDAIVDGVIIRDNIAMLCESSNGKKNWLVLCDKPKHMMIETFTNAYKNAYYEGNSVIQRWYYELIQLGSMTYNHY
jgi:hypothetical protein